MKSFYKVLLCVLVIGLLAVSVLGKEAPKPTGDVVLTVSGAIALTNDVQVRYGHAEGASVPGLRSG